MDFITPGYEDLELSTQILIKEALNRGIRVEVLDREDNFLLLEKAGKTEYVKQATRTSADRYIAPLIMENKAVTKMVLAKHGIRVPGGKVYDDVEQARSAYGEFIGSDRVIKPKSTNFGIGITISKGDRSENEYRRAVEEAFEYGRSVIVEEFIEGREYRFLIIDGTVVAVLHRLPANVIGDGNRTVMELVEEKNGNPLRGIGYKTPLEKLRTGAVEKSFLHQQGKDFSTIPQNGERVFLRKNTNISTGGDSIDCTDDVDDFYKEIAIQASDAIGAKMCGADIIIRDPTAEPKVLADSYGIIELNFNPAIHIHGFPYRGENRHAEKNILDLLGF
ncbi:MAG: bifunctional glutamate--cysteine ligase GshA/glutathione synthetase GshB [Proteobacteria bacterium]|nr:bifunctional glutamate--cysteine ligase GshA/glutathione synthetase GshB [Pseudomonadota bacterium]